MACWMDSVSGGKFNKWNESHKWSHELQTRRKTTGKSCSSSSMRKIIKQTCCTFSKLCVYLPPVKYFFLLCDLLTPSWKALICSCKQPSLANLVTGRDKWKIHYDVGNLNHQKQKKQFTQLRTKLRCARAMLRETLISHLHSVYYFLPAFLRYNLTAFI